MMYSPLRLFPITALCALLLLITCGSLSGQTNDTTQSVTPFSEGRFLLGASAFLSSSNLSYEGTILEDSTFSNNYTIDVSAAYFIRERLAIGVVFEARRRSNSEVVIRELETLGIGPLARYYISRSNEGSVFFQGAFGYGRLRDEVKVVVDQQNAVDVLSTGNGFFGIAGVGYSYVLFNRVALEMQFSFVGSKYFTETNDRLRNTIEDVDVVGTDFVFGFGINVLLD